MGTQAQGWFFFSKFKIKIMFSTLLAAYMVLVPLLVYVNVCVVYINLTVMNSFVIKCVLLGQPQSFSTKQTSFIGQVDLLWKSPTYWLPLWCSGRPWYGISSGVPYQRCLNMENTEKWWPSVWTSHTALTPSWSLFLSHTLSPMLFLSFCVGHCFCLWHMTHFKTSQQLN